MTRNRVPFNSGVRWWEYDVEDDFQVVLHDRTARFEDEFRAVEKIRRADGRQTRSKRRVGAGAPRGAQR